MRTIKFRAWDKKKKEMFYSESKQEDNDESFDLAGFFNYVWDNDLTLLMQFTGLKDKNGEEIFEGDIVKKGRFIYTITFCKGEFSLMRGTIVLLSHISELDFLTIDKCLSLDIIGNIYENQELLEDGGVK